MNHPAQSHPRIRAVDPQPLSYGDRPYLALRDPLGLTDKTVMVPAQLAPLLYLCDGTRDPARLRSDAAVQFGILLPDEVIAEFLAACDHAGLLANTRYEELRAEALAAYRSAPFRPPALAGSGYPADAAELRAALDSLLAASGVREAEGVRGVLSPHIDYQRGQEIYAAVWQRAARAVREADVAIVFGTDHYGAEGATTLTRTPYATPFGTLPLPSRLLDAAVSALGEERAFAGELNHRTEHSVELAAVWMHHLRGTRPLPMLPVLCGSFSRFIAGDAGAGHDATVSALLSALREATAGQRVLVVVAGDLAHVGLAFGGEALYDAERAALEQADAALLRQMELGDAGGFMAEIRACGDQNNVCGVPPAYLGLRLLAPAHGETIAYSQCPADEEDTSFVSVAGMVWY